ncbi:hypothetical protein SDC9_212416 [bioreactor metagenome]|uniref:Uncharacterized protein n=1 Tax=bioreactor metagenome TaxID=1076179 RepID=A0A645JNH1_9ZZZZ
MYSFVNATILSRPLVANSFLFISYKTSVRRSLETAINACFRTRTVSALVMKATKNIMTNVTGYPGSTVFSVK